LQNNFNLFSSNQVDLELPLINIEFMNSLRTLSLLTVLFFCCTASFAQVKKFDTTFKIGDVGYKVVCNNKNADQNGVTIKPVEFKNTAREVSFNIRGKVIKGEIGDLNNDGFPDLMIYIFGVPNAATGTAVCVSSVENASLAPILFPDIYDNPKLRDGYKGYDEFSINYGVLNRSFPVYKAGDADDKPTGGKRMIQYQVVTENGRPSFKVSRTYDVLP